MRNKNVTIHANFLTIRFLNSFNAYFFIEEMSSKLPNDMF